MFRIFAIMLFVAMIDACSVIPDKNQDLAKNNIETFRKDLKECREDYPEQASGVHIRQLQGCMQLRGWR